MVTRLHCEDVQRYRRSSAASCRPDMCSITPSAVVCCAAVVSNCRQSACTVRDRSNAA